MAQLKANSTIEGVPILHDGNPKYANGGGATYSVSTDTTLNSVDRVHVLQPTVADITFSLPSTTEEGKLLNIFNDSGYQALVSDGTNSWYIEFQSNATMMYIGGEWKYVIENSAGKDTFTTPATVFNSGGTGTKSVSALDNSTFVVAYRDDSNSGYGTAVVGSVSGTSITFGTATVFNSGSTNNTSVSAMDASTFVVTYQDYSNSEYGTARQLAVDGNTIKV